jgi:hypothetical protein
MGSEHTKKGVGRGALVSEELVDITPSPRILQVLGDIEFDHWQCLAELVDNGFDEFLDIKREGLEWDEFAVTISLPKSDDIDPMVEVRDNGRGMEVEEIRQAVSAGFSGNDQFEKLGLFGMGFNIATARLGNVAEVLSKREGETEWRGVRIDLRKISQQGEFSAPVIAEEADDADEHGTRVIVKGLKPEPREYFNRAANVARLRAKLGDVYSPLLSEEGFHLYVSGQAVKPRRACVWDDPREVSRRRYGKTEAVPVKIKVERDLPDMEACGNCRNWQEPGQGVCKVCGSDDLEVRRRRVWGWLGIQRYLHQSDFGVDFIRNGRKILLRDKKLFTWRDPNDDSNEVQEYPVEVPYEGRIVGEIHIDHVPVNYQKNAFEYDGQAWRAMVRILRGEGPLQPNKRKEAGYSDRNDSPLARLFDGFRRNDPGLNYLVPGNGQTALKEKARDWAKHFRNGDPDYQSDEVWYEAAKHHDELVEDAKLAGVGASGEDGSDQNGDVLEGMGLGDDPVEENEAAPDDEKPKESEQERQERFKSGGKELSELSDEYSVPSVGTMKVVVYLVHGARVTTPEGEPAPVYLSQKKGGKGTWYAFIDAHSPIFTEFGASPTDLFLAELAHHLKIRASSAEPLTHLLSELKARHLPDLKLDSQTLSASARELLSGFCERMAEALDEKAAAEIWAGVEPLERSDIETQATLAGAALDEDPGASTEFLRYLPPMLVPRVVDDHPELILDGSVLAANYTALSAENEEARRVLRGRVVSYLTDLALAAEVSNAPVAELHRVRHTIDLVREQIAGAEDRVGGAS